MRLRTLTLFAAAIITPFLLGCGGSNTYNPDLGGPSFPRRLAPTLVTSPACPSRPNMKVRVWWTWKGAFSTIASVGALVVSLRAGSPA